jgi:hypothetical protein
MKKISEALAAMRSCIKSGEPWTSTMEGVFVAATAELVRDAGTRDGFAGLAMQALVGNPAASQAICDNDPRYDETNFADVVALNAYGFSDAMMRARHKEPAPAESP